MSVIQEYRVAGMTCGHCQAAVTNEVSAISGVTQVVVDLQPEGASTVTVTSDTEIGPDQVKAAVAEAGYELVG